MPPPLMAETRRKARRSISLRWGFNEISFLVASFVPHRPSHLKRPNVMLEAVFECPLGCGSRARVWMGLDCNAFIRSNKALFRLISPTTFVGDRERLLL